MWFGRVSIPPSWLIGWIRLLLWWFDVSHFDVNSLWVLSIEHRWRGSLQSRVRWSRFDNQRGWCIGFHPLSIIMFHLIAPLISSIKFEEFQWFVEGVSLPNLSKELSQLSEIFLTESLLILDIVVTARLDHPISIKVANLQTILIGLIYIILLPNLGRFVCLPLRAKCTPNNSHIRLDQCWETYPGNGFSAARDL